MKNIIIYLLVGSLTLSCSKECWEGSGDDVKEARKLDSFNQIVVNNNFTLHLIQDSLSFVEIHSKENLVSKIETQVSNNILTISDNNSCKLMKDYYKNNIYIHCTDINKIRGNGTTNIYSEDTLVFDKLLLDIKGDLITWDFRIKSKVLNIQLHSVVGEMKIKGEVSYLYLYTSGRNHCFLKDLICEGASVNHSTMGDYYLTVKDRLSLTINNSGDFYCYGDPVYRNFKITKNAGGKIYFVK